MAEMFFNVICESDEMTQKVLDLPRTLGDASKKVFSYVEFYDELPQYFAYYLNDLEKDDKAWKEDGKFKADFGNPFDSGNIDGFSESCYINDYCMVISFFYDKKGKIYSWGWNKVHKGSLHNLALANGKYIMAKDYLKMGDNLMSYSESCVENIEDEIAVCRMIESPWCAKSKEVIVEIKDEEDENGEVQDNFAWITVKNVGNFILIEDVLIKKDCIKTVENKVEEESLVMVTLTDDEEHIWDYDNYDDDALRYIFVKIIECLSW